MGNRKEIIDKVICFSIAGIIMISTLYFTYTYLWNEPEEVRARADELCMNFGNTYSTIVTRSIGNPDEWHFTCGGDSGIAMMSPISESKLKGSADNR